MSLESHKNGKSVLVDESAFECRGVQEGKEPFGYVYCIENRFNGKLYIGSTTDFDRRVFEYIRVSQLPAEEIMKRKRLIDKAICRDGVWSFRMYRIHACYSKDELAKMELMYIEYWKTMAPNGYNESIVTANHITGTKNPNYPKGILPDAQNRRKRSRPVIAVNPDTAVAYVSDSIKLLASEVFHRQRAILSHAAGLGQKAYGFYYFYLDDVSTSNKVKEKLMQYERNRGKRSGCREGRVEEYSTLAHELMEKGVHYLIDNWYTIYVLRYTDTEQRFELTEFEYAKPGEEEYPVD